MVMAATFAIEFSLMFWVLTRYSTQSKITQLAAALLGFLSLFQLAEYGVCEQFVLDPSLWSRIGFASISLLPPLGVHFVQHLSGAKNFQLSYLAYIMGMLFVAYFIVGDAFLSTGCHGNYAIFQIQPVLGGFYFAYYYLWLLVAIWYAFISARKVADAALSKALYAVVLGYLAFAGPATFIHAFLPETKNGLPSIMCGFALIFALIIVFYVMPRSGVKRKISE